MLQSPHLQGWATLSAGLRGSNTQPEVGPQQSRTFYETENVVLVHEEVEVTDAVPTVPVVLKVDPEPCTDFPVQDVKCP